MLKSNIECSINYGFDKLLSYMTEKLKYEIKGYKFAKTKSIHVPCGVQGKYIKNKYKMV